MGVPANDIIKDIMFMKKACDKCFVSLKKSIKKHGPYFKFEGQDEWVKYATQDLVKNFCTVCPRIMNKPGRDVCKIQIAKLIQNAQHYDFGDFTSFIDNFIPKKIRHKCEGVPCGEVEVDAIQKAFCGESLVYAKLPSDVVAIYLSDEPTRSQFDDDLGETSTILLVFHTYIHRTEIKGVRDGYIYKILPYDEKRFDQQILIKHGGFKKSIVVTKIKKHDFIGGTPKFSEVNLSLLLYDIENQDRTKQDNIPMLSNFFFGNVDLCFQNLNFIKDLVINDQCLQAKIQPPKENITESCRQMAYTTGYLAFLAIRLLNAKNIGTKTHKPTRSQRKKHPGSKIFEYKTLTIVRPGQKEKSNGDQGAPQVVGLTPLHFCQGHFKTFTEEKPLFGKVVGEFWWSPQMRGNAKNGIIEKEYKVVC